MSEIAKSLASLPLFAGLLREDLLAAASLWEARSLPAGETLWWHGDMAEELALVLSGSLRIRINGKAVGTVEAGEVVGEAAAWTRSSRTASVHAQTVASLAVLPSEQLPRLRAQHVAVYDCLLEHALSGLARRVRQVLGARAPVEPQTLEQLIMLREQTCPQLRERAPSPSM